VYVMRELLCGYQNFSCMCTYVGELLCRYLDLSGNTCIYVYVYGCGCSCIYVCVGACIRVCMCV